MSDRSLSALTIHPNHLYVAVLGSEVCGFVMKVHGDDDRFELQKLSVSSRHRRLGIASRQVLIDFALCTAV